MIRIENELNETEYVRETIGSNHNCVVLFPVEADDRLRCPADSPVPAVSAQCVVSGVYGFFSDSEPLSPLPPGVERQEPSSRRGVYFK